MHITELSIRNLRNIEKIHITPHPQFNFIFGKNAQGKTSIIEAIYLLSQLKSFRTTDRNQLIRSGSDFAKIDAEISKNDLATALSLCLTAEGRKIEVDGKAPPTRRNYAEIMPVILFEPRHIYLFRDSPSIRRTYLNRAVFLTNPAILPTLTAYEKTITQKNRHLKDRGDPALLEVWNERLIELGSTIILARKTFFRTIAEPLAREYQRISGTEQVFSLTYLANIGEDIFSDQNSIQELFRAQLKKRAEDEAIRRESLVGPHRDDFLGMIDGRDVGLRGSQGENRSALIAFKLAQLTLFASSYQFAPIFLLDDVASELDEIRCQHLFSTLRDAKSQVFLTTTENRLNTLEFKGFSASFLVDNGCARVLGF